MSEKLVGRYQVIQELGRGGMAAVYRAHDPRFERDVAIKMLPSQFNHDPAFRDRFEREAHTIASLEHEAVVPVYDFGEHQDQPYLVMRLMTGGSLKDRLQGGSLYLGQAATILQRIGSALDKAHANGIIHRDLKPDNILFDEEGNAYLSDFGIVKLSDATVNLTGDHLMLGTPAYMSPEQVRGDAILDALSDIYSLGVILYQMLSGLLPYHADTAMGLALQHVTEPVPDILAAKPDLPASCRMVIRRAMAKEKQNRFATASDMAVAVAAIAQGGEPHSPAGSYEATMIDSSPGETAHAIPQSIGMTAPENGGRAPAKTRKVPIWGWIVGVLVLVCLVGGFAAGFVIVSAGEETPETAPMAALTSTPAPTTEPATLVTPTPSPSPANTARPSPTATATKLPTRTAAPNPTPTIETLPPRFVGDDGLEMRLVPAGEFLMGSTEAEIEDAMAACRGNADRDPCHFSEFSSEMPQHELFLSAYYMDIFEITNAQYRACVDDGACDPPDESSNGRYVRERYYDLPLYDNYPVVWVSWYDADDYCRWAGEQLPTEAQWEKAAAGESGSVFPWGDSFDPSRANTEEAGGNELYPVGSFPNGASPYGIHDLAGSVWEWVADWYDPNYYSGSPGEDPAGPSAELEAKVLRGGSFGNFQYYARTANRGSKEPVTSTGFRGFRCVINAQSIGADG